MLDRTPLHERAMGRWRSILLALQIAVPSRPDRHGPCPTCGGVDRFRFDDRDGRGTWICNQCGAGNGVELVMRSRGWDFREAAAEIERVLPDTVIALPKRRRDVDPEIYRNLWRASLPLDGSDPASWYLRARGIQLEQWPVQLRFQPRMTYRYPDGKREQHPAMLALFVSPDREAFTIHATYLDATGRKAAVPEAKKLAPLPVPSGGAVRLSPSAETMGIAEGIETALSASQLHGIPVWSALSSGGLMKWQPPDTAKHIIVCGDHDTSFAGQLAAFSLAHRLRLEKRDGIPRWGRIEVRCPGITIEADLEDTDWNDLAAIEARGMREAAE